MLGLRLVDTPSLLRIVQRHANCDELVNDPHDELSQPSGLVEIKKICILLDS